MVLAALTTYPELWAAGVDIVGIANFITFLERTGAWRRKVREDEYGSLERDREFLRSISPLFQADRIVAPLLVIHGANDHRYRSTRPNRSSRRCGCDRSRWSSSGTITRATGSFVARTRSRPTLGPRSSSTVT